MMQVTIDIVPGGIDAHRHTIETLYIGNVSNLADLSDYHVYTEDPRRGGVKPAAFIKGHWRSHGARALLRRVLDELP